MTVLIISIAFVLGVILGAIGTLIWYIKEYKKMMDDVKMQEVHLNELKKRIDALSVYEPVESIWPKRNPYINTPDGVVNYLRAKYMPDQCVDGAEVDESRN